MLPSSSYRSAFVLFGWLIICAGTTASGLWGQEVIPTPPPAPTPYPAKLDGAFVPAHVILEQADARHPPTAEGWIVRATPNDSWLLDVDPAGRSLEQMKYMLELRQFDSQIRLTRADIDHWRRRLSNYRYFNKAGALLLPMEYAYLALIAAEEQLKNLRLERSIFVREHYLEQRTPVAANALHENVIDVSN